MSDSYNETNIYKGNSSSGGGILSIQPGYRIEVDNTDPLNPIISVKIGDVLFGQETFPIASTRNAVGIPNINNAGALLGTLYYSPIKWALKSLTCFVKQIGGGAVRLCVYKLDGNMLGCTAPFIPNVIGFKTLPIIAGPGGAALSEVIQESDTGYYLTIHGNQSANGAQFYGADVGTTFGPQPWISWSKDNIALPPDLITGGSESSQRFYIAAQGVL